MRFFDVSFDFTSIFRFISFRFVSRMIFCVLSMCIKCKIVHNVQIGGRLLSCYHSSRANSHQFSFNRIKINDLKIASTAECGVHACMCVCFCSLLKSLHHRRKTLILFRECASKSTISMVQINKLDNEVRRNCSA